MKFSKDFFVVAIVMTAILLPVRLVFVTYVSDNTWGSLGLISAISVVMIVLVKKHKLGWFGRMFENEMTRMTKGKRKLFILSWFTILSLYFAISMIAIDQGMTIYYDETMRIYDIVMERYDLDFMDTGSVVSTLEPEAVVNGVDDYANAMVNDFAAIAITQAIMNVASNGFLLHFHSVFFIETVEVLGVFVFYSIALRKNKVKEQVEQKV